MGGSSSKTTQNSQTSPWAPQASQIQNAFKLAQNIYNQRQAAGPYTGDRVAGSNAPMSNAISNANAFANGPGSSLANAQVQSGQNSLPGALNGYLNNAQNFANQGLGGAAQLMPGQLGQALNNAGVSGGKALDGAQSNMSNVINQAMSDPTQQLAHNAQSYMNSSAVKSIVDATNANIDQTLNQTTLPGINRAAASGGALNSSRAGAANAQAQGQAALAKAHADSSIYNSAYNQGLSTAAGQRASGLSTAAGAAQSQGAMGNAALMGAAGLQQNYASNDFNARLAANGQMGNAASLANNVANSGMQNALNNWMLGSGAGQAQNAMDQNALNNDYQKWQQGNGYNQGILNDYMNTVGSRNWGGVSNGTSSSSQSSNLAGDIFGGLLGGASIASRFFGGGQ